MNRQRSISLVALLGLGLGIAAVVVAVVAVVGYRGGDLHFVTAINVFEWAVYTAGAALLVSLVGIGFSRPGGARRGLTAALLGLVLALPLVWAGVMFEYTARAYPPINDITTDTEDPPTFWEVPNPAAYPGPQVAAQQQAGYPDLGPLMLSLPPERVFELAGAVARDMGWEIVSEDTMDLQIEAVATSFLFGFPDNVAVRVMDEGGQTRVDVRSHSRLGQIDRGANAKRIRAFLEALDQHASSDQS